MNDAEVRLQVKLDSSSAEKSVSNLSKKTDNLSSKFTKVGKIMTVGVTAPLTALATAGVKYNATMETYLANLTTLLGGNQQEAQNLLNTLKEMAATTPYETTDLVKATQKMMAFGISANDSLNYLQMLGDISMGDANKMDSLTLAFSQMGASGRASMEDINQMIDQGFNPLTIISQKTGESMADLRDRVSDGEVSFQEIADAMKTATSEGGIYFGSMDKASQTTAGKISTLKDDFNSALGSMTESLLPFVTSAVEKFSKLAKWFGNLDNDGKKMVLIFSGILASIGPISFAIGKLIKVGTGISKIVSVIKSWNLVTKAMTAAQWLLNVAMNANPIALIVTTIVGLIAIIVLLWTKCEWFREGVMTIITTIWNAIQSAMDFIISIFTTVFNLIWTIVQNYVNFWITVWATIFTVVSTVLTTIWNTIQTVFNFIWGIISGVINSIISAFQKVANVVKSVFTSVKNAISSLFSGVANILKAPINGLITLVNKVIKGLNKIKMPDWVPAIGGKGINIPLIPKLATGTNYIAREGLAYLHEGEAVVPKKYNPALGGNTGATYVTVVADMDVNKFGKAFVNNVKTFSGGAKNSYNYGGAR